MNKIRISIIIVLMASINLKAQTIESSDSISIKLPEVVMTAKQPATKLIGNTLISIITGSSLQNIGTCLDVLAQLPLIMVCDDEVSIVGKGVPEIYIDGRQMRDADELRQLQSNNIKKVELVLAPGAMYSNDTKAILKISTRRSFMDGLSLTERAESTFRRKWSGNNLLDANYRSGWWDIFASGSIAHSNSLVKGQTINELYYLGEETIVGSSQRNTYPSTNSVIKAGLNYAEGKQAFGAYYRFNPEYGDLKNDGTEWLNSEIPIKRLISRTIHGSNHLISTYYDNIFAEKYHIHFDGNFRDSRATTDVTTTYPNQNTSDVSSHDNRTSSLWAGKVIMDFPALNGIITLGTQDSYTHTYLDYKMLNESVGQYIPSSISDAKQTSVATFLSWDKTFGKLNFSTGIRYEYVSYLFHKNGKKDTEVSRSDNLLTPDVSIGWTPNEQVQTTLSYRMTTLRPPYSQLTGSLGYVGQNEIEGGNPTLHDERMHDVQMLGRWKGFILQVDYTNSIDTYGFVKYLYPANSLQLIIQPINMNLSALDAYLIWSKEVGAWTPNITIGMHRQWLELDGDKYNRPIISYYLDNLITLPYGFLITLNAYGQTSGYLHTNRFGSTWFSMDASISKSVCNKSIQLKLSASDIFNTANNSWTMNTFGVYVDKRQTYDNRGITLSATYRFQPRPNKYKGKNASDAEINRL